MNEVCKSNNWQLSCWLEGISTAKTKPNTFRTHSRILKGKSFASACRLSTEEAQFLSPLLYNQITITSKSVLLQIDLLHSAAANDDDNANDNKNKIDLFILIPRKKAFALRRCQCARAKQYSFFGEKKRPFRYAFVFIEWVVDKAFSVIL